jgi:hypothetical protein
LKLSNLLQLDRFEEDLNISRVRLHLEAKRKAGSLSMSFSEYMRSLIRKDLEGGQQ